MAHCLLCYSAHHREAQIGTGTINERIQQTTEQLPDQTKMNTTIANVCPDCNACLFVAFYLPVHWS